MPRPRKRARGEIGHSGTAPRRAPQEGAAVRERLREMPGSAKFRFLRAAGVSAWRRRKGVPRLEHWSRAGGRSRDGRSSLATARAEPELKSCRDRRAHAAEAGAPKATLERTSEEIFEGCWERSRRAPAGAGPPSPVLCATSRRCRGTILPIPRGPTSGRGDRYLCLRRYGRCRRQEIWSKAVALTLLEIARPHRGSSASRLLVADTRSSRRLNPRADHEGRSTGRSMADTSRRRPTSRSRSRRARLPARRELPGAATSSHHPANAVVSPEWQPGSAPRRTASASRCSPC